MTRLHEYLHDWNPEQFQACFLAWVRSLVQLSDGEVIAIDGKTLRQSYDTADDKAAIHIVSAWATANRLVLGQRKVDAKSNEITAIPQLIKLLELDGCIVTIESYGWIWCMRKRRKKAYPAE